MFNFIKLGLYLPMIGDFRLDPMVFELIAHERRLEQSKRAAETPVEDQHQDNSDEGTRKAA